VIKHWKCSWRDTNSQNSSPYMIWSASTFLIYILIYFFFIIFIFWMIVLYVNFS
jgi:hypothetical protein